MARGSSPKQVGALHHSDKRLNIPTAEMQSFFQREEDHSPLPRSIICALGRWPKASNASVTPTTIRSSYGTASASP